MPQVIKTQPTGAFTTGGQSTGAVIFDKPQYDPTTIALKVADDLDTWSKERAVEAAKVKADKDKLVADLSFDSKGAFPDDTEYFKEGAKNLISSQATLAGLETNNPQFGEALKKANIDKSWLQSDVNESTKQWEQFKLIEASADAGIKEGKIDAAKYKDWVARVRVTRSPQERRKLFEENPIQEAPVSLNTSIDNALKEHKADVTKKVVSKGGVITEESKEKRFSDADLDPVNGLPMSLYASDPKVRNAANVIFENGAKLKAKDPTTLTSDERSSMGLFDYYTDEASKLSAGGKYVPPQALLIKDQLGLKDYIKTEDSFKEETAATKEMAKVGAGAKELKNAAEGTIKFLADVASGNPNKFKQTADPNTLGGWSGQFYGSKPFSNMQLGTYSKKQTWKDDKGNDVSEVTDAPNNIRYFWNDNGVVRLATDESIQNYKEGKGAASPFTTIDNISEIVPQLSLALVPEGKSANFLQAFTEVVRDKKWGIGNSNVNFDWEKVAGLTKDEAAKRKTETTEQQVGTKKVATATYDPTTKTTTVKQPPAKVESKKETTEYKHSATGAGGAKIYSNDLVNWVNDKGVAIK